MKAQINALSEAIHNLQRTSVSTYSHVSEGEPSSAHSHAVAGRVGGGLLIIFFWGGWHRCCPISLFWSSQACPFFSPAHCVCQQSDWSPDFFDTHRFVSRFPLSCGIPEVRFWLTMMPPSPGVGGPLPGMVCPQFTFDCRTFHVGPGQLPLTSKMTQRAFFLVPPIRPSPRIRPMIRTSNLGRGLFAPL